MRRPSKNRGPVTKTVVKRRFEQVVATARLESVFAEVEQVGQPTPLY